MQAFSSPRRRDPRHNDVLPHLPTFHLSSGFIGYKLLRFLAFPPPGDSSRSNDWLRSAVKNAPSNFGPFGQFQPEGKDSRMKCILVIVAGLMLAPFYFPHDQTVGR